MRPPVFARNAGGADPVWVFSKHFLLRNIWPLCHSAFFWKFPMVDIDEILAKAIRVPISTCPLLDKSKILKLQKMIGKHYAENR